MTNPPPVPWCYRCAALAATLGVLTGPVVPGRPADAAVPSRAADVAVPYRAVAAVRPGPAVVNNLASNDIPPATSELVYQDGAAAAAPFAVPLASRANNSRGQRGETVNVVIPRWEGSITITVSNTPVQLSAGVLSADRKTMEFTGQLPGITVTDNRYVSEPRWSVTGQVTDFSGDGRNISGTDLGWTPSVVTQNADHNVTAGPAVSPGTKPGLTDPSVLAAATATKGLGTSVLGAALDLSVPANTKIGSQAATLFITLVEQA
jgi:hypothetical protein